MSSSTTLTNGSNTFATAESNNKYKTYLIEKLLNGETTPSLQQQQQQQESSSKPSSPSKDYFIPAVTTLADDQRSETGTYTIDENVPDIAILDDNNDNDHHDDDEEDVETTAPPQPLPLLRSPPRTTPQANHNGATTDVVHMRKSMSNTIELISARAAIDETFGIVSSSSSNSKRHEMNASDDGRIHKTTSVDVDVMALKRSPQKVPKIRNKTYSLRKDVTNG